MTLKKLNILGYETLPRLNYSPVDWYFSSIFTTNALDNVYLPWNLENSHFPPFWGELKQIFSLSLSLPLTLSHSLSHTHTHAIFIYLFISSDYICLSLCHNVSWMCHPERNELINNGQLFPLIQELAERSLKRFSLIDLSIYLSILVCSYLSIYLSICLSLFISIYPSIYPCLFISIYLS